MAHESFEDEATAQVMNELFVNIKVDREERPDLDKIYQTAFQILHRRAGGWPLTMFLTHDDHVPFVGGTYFPKTSRHGMPAFTEILRRVSAHYRQHSKELREQNQALLDALRAEMVAPSEAAALTAAPLQAGRDQLVRGFDPVHGGFGDAPKFPHPGGLERLLRHWVASAQGGQPDRPAETAVWHTLRRMARGGIYDHLGGGFYRYSVDAEWGIPHFEKMLYDNAQLTGTYARAFALTGNPLYRKVVEETIAFCERELSDPSGLFYASLDADSEGMEGAFYAWTGQELKETLTGDYDIFSALYGCKEEGNWEHGLNVLAMTAREEEFAARQGIAPEHLQAMVLSCRERLAEARLKRIRPATDDKILTCWNAMMISALAEASGVFGREEWLVRAERAATFYLSGMKARQGKLWRNAKGGTLSGTAFLDDHVFLAEAFAALYRATLESMWLEAAVEVTETAIRRFGADGGLFYRLAPADEPALFRETVEISDNVIPSANSRMAVNLLTLGHLAGRNEWIQLSGKMLSAVWPALSASPGFHAGWYSLAAAMTQGPATVSLEGDNRLIALRELAGHYLPGVICPAKSPVVAAGSGALRIYVCCDKTCYPPVSSVAEAVALLSE